jgi:hypothetical protein
MYAVLELVRNEVVVNVVGRRLRGGRWGCGLCDEMLVSFAIFKVMYVPVTFSLPSSSCSCSSSDLAPSPPNISLTASSSSTPLTPSPPTSPSSTLSLRIFRNGYVTPVGESFTYSSTYLTPSSASFTASARPVVKV